MRQPELTRLLADRLLLIGPTERQLHAACDKVRQAVWRRIPLYTNATLETDLLQSFVNVRTELDILGFTEVYEEFIAGYLLTDELHRWSPMSWLRAKLGLTQVDASQLFSEGINRGRKSAHPKLTLQYTVALAALADYNYGADRKKSNAVTYVVESGQYKYGVEAGRPVSNLAKNVRTSRVGQLFCKRGLEHYGRDDLVSREDSETDLYSQLQAFAIVNAKEFGPDLEGFLLGLNLTRWRHRGTVPRVIRDTIIGERNRAGLLHAIHLCTGFANFANPREEMRDLLVPTYLTPREFTDMFGSTRTRITPEIEQRWRIALDNLAEEANKEEQ